MIASGRDPLYRTTMLDAVSDRARGFGACILGYATALLAAWLVSRWLPESSPLWVAAAGDAVATLVIFGWSRAYDNSSVYDAYWSVAPAALAVYWSSALPAGDSARKLAVLGLVLLWAARLTWNWARRWRGLDHEDWRYVDIRRRTRGWYWPVSLLGIHFMPTVVVFLGCLPVHAALTVHGSGFGPLDVVASLITATAIWIEASADHALTRFVRTRQNGTELLETGLWAWSRHPNYFGEVLFWWGIGLFGLSATPEQPLLLVGPFAVTCLFVFVSIPMMDRHLGANHPAYADRLRRVSGLLPWFPP